MKTLNKKKRLNKQAFILKIKLFSDDWHYKPGETYDIFLFARNERHAIDKLDNNYSGSEFPVYAIIEIIVMNNLDQWSSISWEDFKLDENLFNSEEELKKYDNILAEHGYNNNPRIKIK